MAKGGEESEDGRGGYRGRWWWRQRSVRTIRSAQLTVMRKMDRGEIVGKAGGEMDSVEV